MPVSTQFLVGHTRRRHCHAALSARMASGPGQRSFVTDPDIFFFFDFKDHSRPYLPTISNPRAGIGQYPGQNSPAPGTAFLKDLCTRARTLARWAWNQGIGRKPQLK